MSAKEYRQKSVEELRGVLFEQCEKLAALRVDVALNRLSNVREIRTTKRDIACIRTVLRERGTLKHQKPAS